MKRILTLFPPIVLLLAACSAPPESVIQNVEVPVTVLVTVERPVEVTRVVEVTREVTVTQIVTAEPTAVAEQPVTSIPLAGPAADSNAEISGLAWYGDYLILLPQYPDFAAPGEAFLYALPEADILAFLDGATSEPLQPIAVPFIAPDLSQTIAGFEGYEAVAFAGDRAFIAVEASPRDGMRGYVLAGTMAPDLSGLTVDTAVMGELPPQSQSPNKAYEALLLAGDSLLAFYEVNGALVNPAPAAHRFDQALNATGTISVSALEYRLTDVTELDANGRFWALNFFFQGDSDLLPAVDPLVEKYGEGPSHSRYDPVERLVEFQYDESGIRLTETPPIQLELFLGVPRNWEGVARLDGRGFLLATDKFPETILAFIPNAD